MEKMNCNIIQDILPLYADEAVCEDTRTLVEEHLKGCPKCRKMSEELKREFAFPTAVENSDAKDLKHFKRFLARKRIKIILASVVGAAAVIVGIFMYMNSKVVRISYENAGIVFLEEDEDEVKYKTQIKGQYHWNTELDRETGIGTVYFEQSLWEKYAAELFYKFDHVHSILKKDMIKEVYADADGTETVIWEASEKEKKAYQAQDKDQPLG